MLRAKGPQRTGTIADAGPEEVLQEDDLELDRVLDGVAVVLEDDGGAARRGQLVDEREVGHASRPRGVRKGLRVRPKRSGSP